MNTIVQVLVILLIVGYTASLLFILLYSFTQANLVYRYLFQQNKYKSLQHPVNPFPNLPTVTVQLPLYNEKYVAERLIDCIARLDYPRHLLQIQVLDDSTDETVQLVAAKVALLKDSINIKHLHRSNRAGYKAGALKEGLETACGEFIALFDADFLPGKDFLLKTIPYFTNPAVGMVQTKWTWLNKNHSFITRLQAFALDAHFSVEQVGRNIQQGFINFNGTAGVWRKACILDAGNWHADTLTEDLDLSYRAQLKDWQFVYLEEVTSPSELPPVMSAVKTQQYRWNKGGAETARKHIRHVWLSGKSWPVKWHGLVHLMTSGVFLSAFVCSVLSVPILLFRHNYPGYHDLLYVANFCFTSFFILGMMYLVTSIIQHQNKWKGVLYFVQTIPVFLSVSMGLSLHNAIAVMEGYMGKKTAFVRTPKFNLVGPQPQRPGNGYKPGKLNPLIYAEAFLAAYFGGGILMAFQFNDFTLLPFHLLLLLGYGAVVVYSLKE